LLIFSSIHLAIKIFLNIHNSIFQTYAHIIYIIIILSIKYYYLHIGGVELIFLDNLSPEDLLVLTNAITISLSKDKTADELNVLGNFIVGIGCLMLTVASQQQYLSSIQQQQQANKSKSTPVAEDDTIIG